MFSPAEKFSDNHCDNNNVILQSDVNCHTASFAPQAAAFVACASKRNLRKCKSDSNVERRHSEIDRMGSTISRSKSYDNIETDSIMYESLTKNKKVEVDECFDDSDEDYKLLESTENDDSDSGEEEDSGCAKKAIEQTSNHDDHEIGSPILASNNNNYDCIQQTLPRAGNEIENDSLHEKYSTLPRVKYKKGIVDRDQFSRCSMPYKSFDSRARCSKEEIIHEFGVVIDGKCETAEVLEAPVKSDKLSDGDITSSTTFRSTTLPKTRSRMSEPYSRHSLRQAIDLTMPTKHFRISDASEHNTVIIPGRNEATALGAGMGKKKKFLFFLGMN